MDGLTICKTDGQHGSNELYADTVWAKPYVKSLQRFRPDVVVLNTGYAVNDLYGPIIMGKEDTLRTLAMLRKTTIVASHMEAINHCLLTRAELREFTLEHSIEKQVRLPADGEILTF